MVSYFVVWFHWRFIEDGSPRSGDLQIAVVVGRFNDLVTGKAFEPPAWMPSRGTAIACDSQQQPSSIPGLRYPAALRFPWSPSASRPLAAIQVLITPGGRDPEATPPHCRHVLRRVEAREGRA